MMSVDLRIHLLIFCAKVQHFFDIRKFYSNKIAHIFAHVTKKLYLCNRKGYYNI